ncbi:putative multiple-sugar transport system permease YteP [Paenibacillus allorhizoplanae]|uniref:Multiple-sugar transport system permease YteP n=1 Tax=Paenibacillus allorhizoplanae TaxID=2905648 RepID=A0ABN8GR58_9BACL|nr:putative multiple-sugar transport system permease YteP [Paenibacillus allorhizoplanae]
MNNKLLSTKHEALLAGASEGSTGVVKSSLFRYLRRNHPLYLMLLPGILYFVIFKYIPLLGSVIAFQDYNIYKGFLKSDWVGFQWFEQLVTYPQFKRLIANTIILSFYQIIFAFPAPIILACLLNELRHFAFKRLVQTLLYLPHFLSWTIVYGLVYMMFSSQTGFVNMVLVWIGYEPISFLQMPEYFRTLLISSGIWKEMGWSTIIFLAALAGISPSYYEAARIDGAGRWKQFVHVTFPGLLPAIVILLLLKIGHVLDVGFEQVYLFLNPTTLKVGEVLDTYAYRQGILGGQYSVTTAIGLFKSVIGFTLLITANRISKKVSGEGLF